MKKIALAVAGCLVFALVGVVFYFSDKEYVVIIPEQEIQQRLDKRLPFTKTYFVVFQIALDNPRVDLIEGHDRIHAGLDVVLNLKIADQSKPMGGTVDASGALRYVPEEGAFYLIDPVIENLAIQGLPEQYKEKATQVAERALVQFYLRRPLYTLKVGDVKQAAARLVLKNLVVRNEALEVTLGL